jgi:EAL and modified HD-GYP domain-containing signal transduction protein
LATIAAAGSAGGEFFTLGMFSLIDAIVDQPMENVMATLPLSQSIKDALVRRKGPLVGYLALVECYEKGQWPLVSRLAKALKIEQSRLPAIYLQSVEWADTLSESE